MPQLAQLWRPGRRSDAALAALLAATAVLIYEISAIGHPTPFDYYARLADAFAHGRPWLLEAPPYPDELVPCGPGLCVHLPPLPALVVVPFLTLFAPPTAQTLASAVVGGLASGPTYLALRRLGAPTAVALLTTVFAAFGTNLWFTAADGRAWYLAHATAVLLISVATLAAVEGRRPWIIGALLGAAVLSRYSLALATPGVALLLARTTRRPVTAVAGGIVLGGAPFAVAFLAYNAMRFGTPFETGYGPLAATDQVYLGAGLFNLAYLPRHLYAILLQAPDFVYDSWLFLRPSRLGESVLLVSPAFVYAAAGIAHARGRRVEVVPLALAALGPLLIDMLHGTTGFTQFGYRYWLDPQPFLVPLVGLGACWSAAGWSAPRRSYVAAVAWCVLANLYGVVTILQLGYW